MTEQDYNDLVKYAKSLCLGRYDIEYDTLVADTFIELSGQPFDKEKFKYKMKGILIKDNIYNKGDTFTTTDTMKICKKCNEEKPIPMFATSYERGNSKGAIKNIVRNKCKECVYKEQKDRWIKDESLHTKRKEGLSKAFNKFVEKDRKEWNKYLRERYAEEKKNITDGYIKDLLRSKKKYTTLQMKNNPSIIEEYRKILIEKINKK